MRYRVVVQISRDAAPDRHGRVWSTSFGLPTFWIEASGQDEAETIVMDMLASMVPQDSATTTAAHISIVEDENWLTYSAVRWPVRWECKNKLSSDFGGGKES